MTDPGTPHPQTPEPTRVTPFELAFGEAGFEERLFPAMETEAEQLGVDPSRYDAFSLLPSCTAALADLVPDDAPPDARDQHRAILFQCFGFWRFGKRLYLLDPPAARYLVEAAPGTGSWDLAAPAQALYLQLPANLFWASIAPDTPPEPVDGFFVTTAQGSDARGEPFRSFDALMVLGIRRNRAGFSVVPFRADITPGIAEEWMRTPARDAGRDFDNMLPGGEIAGMYSILTTGEALKLLARAFWYIASNPDALTAVDPLPGAPADDALPRASRLGFVRVSLGSGGDPG